MEFSLCEKSGCTVAIYKEEDIDWQLQNEIHKLLNIAFGEKTSSFVSKTYSKIRPSERVIYFQENIPIAHMGVHHDVLTIGDKKIEVGSLGLWCVWKIDEPRVRVEVATLIMQTSMAYLGNKGVKLAIGVTNSAAIQKRILPNLKSAALSVELKGANTFSKKTDKFLLFNCGLDDADFDFFVKTALSQKTIYVGTEVF